MTATESISVAIISYGTRDDLLGCLGAIRDEPWRELVVVDNGSTDGSAETVRERFPWVHLIENRANSGYGAAANQAVAACTTEYILLLNADTTVERRAVPMLAEYLAEHPDAALVGPCLLNPDGTFQPSCYPFLTPLNVLLVMSGLSGVIGAIPPLARRFLPTMPPDRSRVVPWVKGAAIAIRRSAFDRVGGFDARFFMYGEELDLAYRLAAAGWRTHFAPAARVVHRGGASTQGDNATIELFVWAGLVRFYRLHYAPARLSQLRFVTTLLMVARIARDGLRLAAARDSTRRCQLRRSIEVWGTILRGRVDESDGPTYGDAPDRGLSA